MDTNPFLGVSLYVLAGLSGACFYLPLKGVKRWSWESYWLIWGVAGLLLAPWALAAIVSRNVLSVFHQVSWETLGWCYLFGAMWGFGGLTWGLMIRYLGVGLGTAIGCGVCAAAGTLIPPAFRGQLGGYAHEAWGIATLVGVGIALLGIVATGAAGMSKERELSEEQRKAAVAEFHFGKGILVAIFSGIMSACMAFGLDAGKVEIGRAALHTLPKTSAMWQGIPVVVVVLLGGFTVNFLWCLFLNFKNRSIGDYVKRGAPLGANLLFAAAAGAIWYSQLALLSAGNAKSGSVAFAGWTVFMSSTVIFSTLVGILMREWRGVSRRTKSLLAASFVILVAALVTIGYGNYLKPTDGIIAKVETAALVVRSEDDTEKAFPLDAKSVILLDGRPVAAGALKVGQTVKVTARPAPLTVRAVSKGK
jgi:L-rhamnose-H+ transport protein